MADLDSVPPRQHYVQKDEIIIVDAGLVERGLAVGLDVLQGKSHPHLINLDPQIWDNQSSTGLTELTNHYDKNLNAYYSVSYQVSPYTTYTKEQLIACADV